MTNQPKRSSTALLVAISFIGSSAISTIGATSAFAQTTFNDVPTGYWAQTFIQELASRDIIKGFPDGGFRPNDPVTRAQFAAMLSKAVNKSPVRGTVTFVDVSSNYWAAPAIQKSYTTGFMSGYPGNVFEPTQNIPRVQILVSLANGLSYSASQPTETTLQTYADASGIPNYARNSVAAATENRLVVNYPNVQFLNPNQTATRAEVAAFIYQALVRSGQANAIASPYIVGQTTTPPVQNQTRIPAGNVIALQYSKDKILLGPDEKVPLTLNVAQNIANSQGAILIPAGSQVVGELRTVSGGTQFFASELVFANGRRVPINATSKVVTTTEKVDKGLSAGTLVRNAALGAGAAAAIAAVTGDRAIATEEVLGGAGIGTLIGLFLGRDSVTLSSVNPNTDLAVTLNSDLLL
ncbi:MULTISPECIES: S-layer homology domain-containing protein [Pseudanabaena]|uniref:S-layer domain-containing protein n=2 Tax=Pseudanabaena TaxID=1152 RepID=L8N4A7_9CYAN|nr:MULTISPECIES: S-layer homology domain-containing protein [Pseudanabaena]ELS33934.1 S-layer domain-containing protein [Pseudanabaena biceps PCC 7429]MDG3493843.1 S-layer homology domain-containing protein [Pseudanabaena catenata USMAC16]